MINSIKIQIILEVLLKHAWYGIKANTPYKLIFIINTNMFH